MREETPCVEVLGSEDVGRLRALAAAFPDEDQLDEVSPRLARDWMQLVYDGPTRLVVRMWVDLPDGIVRSTLLRDAADDGVLWVVEDTVSGATAGVLGFVLVLALFAGWRRAPVVVIALTGPHIVGGVLLNGVTTLLGISMKGHHGIEAAWTALASLVGIPAAYTVLRKVAGCSARRAAAVLLLALVVAGWAVVSVHGRLTRAALSRKDAMGVSGAPAR